MPRVAAAFIDTAYLAALIDRRDHLHARARELSRALSGDGTAPVTTDAVLIELGNYFGASVYRAEAAAWIARIRSDERWEVVQLDRPLMSNAEARYRRYDDKNWSMTDCISMEVMERRRIREVATSDTGFEQAGFTVLLA